MGTTRQDHPLKRRPAHPPQDAIFRADEAEPWSWIAPAGGASTRSRWSALRLVASSLMYCFASMGCVGLSYDRLSLGAARNEYETAFPEEAARRSDKTVAYLEKSPLGEIEAVVVLISADRRVAGKLRVSAREPSSAFQPASTRVQLIGEIDPRLTGYERVGPIDTLRAIAADLADNPADALTRDAHGWVSAALVRLLQRWPSVEDEGPAITKVQDYLDRVPAGGIATLTSDERGVFRVAYEAPPKRRFGP